MNVHNGFESVSIAESYVSRVDSRYRDVCVEEAERGLIHAKRNWDLKRCYPALLVRLGTKLMKKRPAELRATRRTTTTKEEEKGLSSCSYPNLGFRVANLLA